MSNKISEIKIEDLFKAVSAREYDKVRFLLRKELDLFRNDLQKSNFANILHEAIYNNDYEISKLLIKYRVINPNTQEKDSGDTCLHIAVKNRNIDIIKLILTHPETDPNIQNYLGNNIIYYTLFGPECDIDIINLLVQDERINLNILNDETGNNILHEAIYKKKFEIVKLLLLIENLDVNNYNAKGKTALHIALKIDNIEIIKLLLDHKDININLKDRKKLMAPIHYLAASNNYQILELFIRHRKKDLNIRDDRFGFTVLHFAAMNNSIDIVNLLLSDDNLEINIDLKDRFGNIATDYALSRNYREIYQILSERTTIFYYSSNDNFSLITYPTRQITLVTNILNKKIVNDDTN